MSLLPRHLTYDYPTFPCAPLKGTMTESSIDLELNRILYTHSVWQGGDISWGDIVLVRSRMGPESKAQLMTLMRQRLDRAQSGASNAELQWYDNRSRTIIRTEAARLNPERANSVGNATATNSTTSQTQAGSEMTRTASAPFRPSQDVPFPPPAHE
jgi:hypothetical protein